jgi:NAD(P)-dependent dehydrogenase (short-subunit alcohol dehydrogenase family)
VKRRDERFHGAIRVTSDPDPCSESDRGKTSPVMTRTYVITGAGSGIGAAVAALLAGQGHRVVSVDLHDTDVLADLSTAAGRAGAISAITARTDGRVDAVIAGAGTSGLGATDVRVDYFGAVATLSGLRPLLARTAAPRAVAIASFAVVLPVDDALVAACLDDDEERAVALASAAPADDAPKVYSSAKRALVQWVRREAPTPRWAGAGIALNVLAPGIVRTPMTAGMLADPQVASTLQATVPMPLGGIAEPGVIATALAFLTSDALQSVAGQVLFVDGGAECVVRGDAF